MKRSHVFIFPHAHTFLRRSRGIKISFDFLHCLNRCWVMLGHCWICVFSLNFDPTFFFFGKYIPNICASQTCAQTLFWLQNVSQTWHRLNSALAQKHTTSQYGLVQLFSECRIKCRNRLIAVVKSCRMLYNQGYRGILENSCF